MTKSWQHLGVAVILAVGGTFLSATSVLAQSITIDGTLSPAQTLTGPYYTIPQSVGQTVGNNLFQSFGRFNLNMGEIANFESAGNIRNILSRVTGGASMIDGLIFTNSANVNLFLINPSGIVFGPNASLNVGGSFVASTANALQFGNIGFFSATDKNIPSPLLTINPSALLFNQINQNAAIENNSVAPTGIDPAGFDLFGLRVPDGKSLLLVGGNVTMDGGQLNANGGRVELGGLAEPGNVTLGVDSDNLSLIFPDNVARSEVSLTNQAAIYVEGAGGGNIAVNAKNLDILEGSVLSAGIGEGLGTLFTVAGDITLNATGEIKVAGGSRVSNLVSLGSQGNGGNITIDSGSFSLRDRAFLAASTLGQGNAGNVTVRAKDSVDLANAGILSTVERAAVGNGGNIDINAATLSLIDVAQLQAIARGQGNVGNVIVNATKSVSLDGSNTAIFSSVGSVSDSPEQRNAIKGNGGNIQITTPQLSLTKGAALEASTFGQGDAGNVIINATKSVSLDSRSTIFSGVGSVSDSLEQRNAVKGNGGNIQITTPQLSLTNRAQLVASTEAEGNAGNVIVNATNSVSLDGTSTIFSGVGSVSATPEQRNGIKGNGGNIQITTPQLSLTNDAQLLASTYGQGDAGNVIVNATNSVSLDGSRSAISSSVGNVSGSPEQRNAIKGNGGNIQITTPQLSLTNGAQLRASTFGQGDAGNVIINAIKSFSLNGSNTGILSAVGDPSNSPEERNATKGNGGNIQITTPQLSLTNNAQLLTNTFAQGDAGNVIINATKNVSLDGSNTTITSAVGDAFNSPEERNATKGNGGNIQITTSQLSLINGAKLLANTLAQGNAGTIKVNAATNVTISGKSSNLNSSGLFVNSQSPTGTAGDIIVTSPRVTLDNSGTLNAQSASGNGGNINLQTDLLLLRRESQISTNAGTALVGGNGGNINIDAGFIVAVPQENSDITANAFLGNGGTVRINAQGIFGIQSRQQPTEESDITASSTGGGINGVVDINTLEIDPSRGFINLPTNVVDTFRLVAQSCSAFGKGGSEFTVTGRGGLPPGPDDFLSSDVVWSDTRLTALPVSPSPGVTRKVRKTADGVAIVPATGWVFDEKKGEVTLIASNRNSESVGSNQGGCIVP